PPGSLGPPPVQPAGQRLHWPEPCLPLVRLPPTLPWAAIRRSLSSGLRGFPHQAPARLLEASETAVPAPWRASSSGSLSVPPALPAVAHAHLAAISFDAAPASPLQSLPGTVVDPLADRRACSLDCRCPPGCPRRANRWPVRAPCSPRCP